MDEESSVILTGKRDRFVLFFNEKKWKWLQVFSNCRPKFGTIHTLKKSNPKMYLMFFFWVNFIFTTTTSGKW